MSAGATAIEPDSTIVLDGVIVTAIKQGADVDGATASTVLGRRDVERNGIVTVCDVSDMEGTQQSGVAFNLRIANLASDGMVLQAARDEAQRILDKDFDLSTPDGQMLQRHMRFLFSRDTNWGMIS